MLIRPALITASLLLHAFPAFAGSSGTSADPALISPSSSSSQDEKPSVRWRLLFRESLNFLLVEHSFRAAFDSDTRNDLGGKFFGGYWNSVSNLHGWADGDPFIVNYVGHPIQGAIAGNIWVHNDLRYSRVTIGRNREYWASRVRAAVFAWAYSEQFEIGPISEATIGHIQSRFPQQGYVDHVITPVLGTGWMIAEDAVDRFLVLRIERNTSSHWVRIPARTFLNPARSFANVMEHEYPWHREVEGEARLISMAKPGNPHSPDSDLARESPLVPEFEFATIFNQELLQAAHGSVACSGGGVSATFNLTSVLGIETEVSGCKMLGLDTNVSGDTTTFLVGPRFSYRGYGHWTPWFHVLFGGEKITEEVLDPVREAAVVAAAPSGVSRHSLHDEYATDYGSAGVALSVGGGIDWAVNPLVAIRLGNIDYLHTWKLNGDTLPGRSSDLRLTLGFVLRK